MKKENTSYKILLIAAIVLMTAAALVFVIVFNDNRSSNPESVSQPDPGPGEADPAIENPPLSDDDTDAGFDPAPDLITSSVVRPADRFVVYQLATENPGLTAELDEEAQSHDCAAVSLVVYDGNEGTYYSYRFGHADIAGQRLVKDDTKFRIASLSKLVVVIVAMKLVDDDKLDLDEDISGYLGYTVRNPGHPDKPITSRMLMQHTSSIFDSQAFLDSIAGRAGASTENLLSGSASYWDVRPGTAFEYSNFGYSILAAVCEMISGEKLDDLARVFLFEPLDIEASFLATGIRDKESIAMIYSSGYHLNRSVETQLENSRSYDLGMDQHLAQGSLVISALDYAKILAMLGNGGVFRNERILSPESVVEIHDADFEGPGYKQGLSSRFTAGGSTGDAADQDDAERRNSGKEWQYVNIDGNIEPSDGFYWHTGSAFGVFAQYIYMASSGTDEGVIDVSSSRGVVVITTGANTDRSATGMINVCTHLSEIAWRGLGFNKLD